MSSLLEEFKVGSLKTELVRVGLVNPDQYKLELGLQAVPPKLQEALLRLNALEEKFPLMDWSRRLMYSVEYASATTLDAKVVSIRRMCDYLDTL